MIAASGSRRGLWVLVAGVCICGCSRSEPLLVSGTTVRDLVSDDSTIVVLYDPARCLSCDPNMLMWQGLKVKDPDAVRWMAMSWFVKNHASMRRSSILVGGC